jgi:alkanesulfonate monooxygenase SsuD/methylene tetrahydromethanopterin reductase-like flavin-dependent oxidoreductase (luciferase family)
MDFGLFVEFPCREGMTEREAFAECFALVDEAEARGVDSVWLAEYHFAPISVLSSPITIASTMTAVQGLGDRVAGSASRVGTTGDWSAQAERVRRMSYEDWLRDKVVYGTPEAVVDRLQQLREELDLTQLLYEINYGRQIPYELQLQNLRLINARVIPQFK